MEKSVEWWVVQYSGELGGKALKLTGYNGIPDRLVLLPDAIAFFVETKAKNGRLSRIQIERKKFLEGLGFKVYVPFTKADVEKIFDCYR